MNGGCRIQTCVLIIVLFTLTCCLTGALTSTTATTEINSTAITEPTTDDSTDDSTESPSTTTSDQPTTITTESPSTTTPESPTTETTEPPSSSTPEPQLTVTTELASTTTKPPTTDTTEPASLTTTTEPPTTDTTEPASTTTEPPTTCGTTACQPLSSPTPELSTTVTTETPSPSTPESPTTIITEPASPTTPELSTVVTSDSFSSITTEPSTVVTTEQTTLPTDSSTVMDTSSLNGTTFSGSLNISAPCNESDKPGDRTRMHATLTDIFSNIPGFLGLIVTTDRSCPTISADFAVVVNRTTSKEAQSDFSLTIHKLLTNQLNLTYNGQQYTAEEVTIIDYNGQAQRFTSTSDPCEIYIAIEPCSFGECTRVGNDLQCMNVTATTDMSTSSEYITTTVLPSTTSAEPTTITTAESLATSTESYDITTTKSSTVMITDGSTLSSETLTTPTDSLSTSTESPTAVDNSTLTTETLTTTIPNNQTTFIDPSTTVVDISSISTETTVTTPGGLSNSTETSGTTTLASNSSTEPSTDTEEPSSSTITQLPTTLSTEQSIETTTGLNGTTFSGSLNISAPCNESDKPGDRTRMHATLTDIFSNLPGFLGINVTTDRSCPTLSADFAVVVNRTTSKEAQSDFSLTIHKLLTNQLNLTYNGQQYTAEEVTIIDYNGQAQQFTSTSEPCEIYIAIEPCSFGECTRVGNDLKCMNVTATTDMSTSSEYITTTVLPSITSTEPTTITTAESLATSTESYNITTTEVLITESSTTNGSNMSTETLTTPTDSFNTSTESTSATTVDNSTFSTESLTTIPNIQTTFIDPSTTAVDNSSISTEATIITTPGGLSTSNETLGTTAVSSNLSTEQSTSTVDNSSISTETTITTTTGGFLNRSEPPTTPTNGSAISTEPPISQTNSSSTSDLPTTPSDVTSSTTEPTTTYGLNQTSDLSTISQTTESSSTTTLSTEPSTATTTDSNEASFSGSVNISALCNQSDETGDRAKINAGLSEIFNAIPGFKRLEVPSRTCPTINAYFTVVVDRTLYREAQSNFSMTIHKLLTNQLSISYDGNQYSVDEITLMDFNIVASKFTNTSDPCVIFTAIKPCDSGSCTLVGNDLECMNMTTTTDISISTEVLTATPESSMTPTEPSTTVTPESSTEPPTTATLETSTAPTEPSTTVTPDSSTAPTEPSTTVTSESSTTPTEPPTTAIPESSTTPTEPPRTVTPESSTTPTEPPTTVTPERSTAPTEPPTTVTLESSTTPTESPPTATPESSTAPTEPPTTVTPESSTAPTEPPTTVTPESSTAPTEPPTTVTPESSTEQSTITTDPNEVTFSGTVKISASCNQSDETGDRLKMQTALTEIFNATPGFKRLEVVSRRCSSIYADFAVVIIKTSSREAQSKFSLTILMLLTYQQNVTYDGKQYTVDEVRITDYNGVSQTLTNTLEPCEIFTFIEPCPYGNCTQIGDTLECMNMTATTEFPETSTLEITSTTQLPSTTTTTELPSTATTAEETTKTTAAVETTTPTAAVETTTTTAAVETTTTTAAVETTTTTAAVETTTTTAAVETTTTTAAVETTTTTAAVETTTTTIAEESTTTTAVVETTSPTAAVETTTTTAAVETTTPTTAVETTTITTAEESTTTTTTQPPTTITTTEQPSTTTTEEETITTTTAEETITTTITQPTTTTITTQSPTINTEQATTQPPTTQPPTTQPPTTQPPTTQPPTTQPPTTQPPTTQPPTTQPPTTQPPTTQPPTTQPPTTQPPTTQPPTTQPPTTQPPTTQPPTTQPPTTQPPTTQPPTTQPPTRQPPTTQPPTTQPPTTQPPTTQPPTTREPTVNEPLPFGATEDSVITGDDITSPRLTSPMTLQIGDGTMGGFNYVVVGTNGIIGLGERYNSFSIQDLSNTDTFNRRILCPFWVDLVADGDGSAVYYKVYKRENQNDATTLNRVDKIIQTFFDDFKNFKSSILYKVTWNNMTFFADRTKRVTFQSLIVSDGRDTFSVTNYIDVNVPSTIGTRISVGYRYRRFVERNTYSNRPACFRMTQVPGNLGYNGFWVTKMTTETTLDPQEIECYNWYAVQSQRRIPNPWWLTCPCNGFAMRFFSFRFAYYRYDPIYNVMCYVSITMGQSLECCYRWGFFGLGPLSRRIPESGSVLSANPIFQPIEYYQDNMRAKEVCCASGHCDWYYALRPRPRFCLRLIPVRTAWFFGDPHINTLDGGKYTFNGYGEYTMMKIDHNGTKFDLQARTDLATNANGTTINATIFSAFVAKDHTGSIVQVEMSRTKTSMYVRGNGRDLTLDFENNPNFVFRTINVSISMNNKSIEASFIQSAITIKISLGVRFLTSETMVDETYMGKVTGLMGNFDGNTTNDFILPNGTTLYDSDVDTERKIYNNFGQLWSIDAATSLFHYDTGLTHDDFSHPEFIPFFVDEFTDDERNKSIEVCGGTKATQACIFDYLATGDKSLAEASGSDDNTAVSDTASLENEIPSIEGDTNIQAEVNKSVEIKFNATDDGTFTYQILQQPQEGFSFNNTTGIATWTPRDNNVANISVTVVDNKGEQAAPVDVSIILCSQCSGHGSCNYNDTRSSTSDMFKYAECVCDDGYSGQDCENDTDGCAQSPCAQGRNCTDLTPAEERVLGRGYKCSDCPAGYLLLDEKCEDINECNSTSTNLCNSATEDCENTEGSYQCNCKMGYRKIGNNCQDIDECIESTSGCEQNCNNTLGSFDCYCITGFTLNNDNKTCNGSSNCSGLNCEYACSKESGSDVCICKAGYKLKDTENCTDINECDVSGICSQGCDNSDGSYTCSCFAGYSLNPDKTTCSECEPPNYGVGCQQTCTCGKGMDRCDPVTGCVCKSGWTGSNCDQDVDECTENPNICGSDKICQNLEGSHTCNCRTGFQKDSQGNCIDIKECDNAASHNCSTDTTVCSNNIGGYTCTCKSGYTRKNFYECEDFDECAAETDGCSQRCDNVDGGFNCECEFGYTLGDDRKTCIEVQDICSLFPLLNCSYGCKKNGSEGSCFCPAGYLLNAQDQRSCVDIDECNDATLNQCNFKEKCINIDGSYNCSCPIGHTLENDGRTCKECNGFTFGEDCKTPCNCGVGSSRCDNVRGCICDGGWTGEKCDIDKDECSSGSSCTKANQECKNSPGSYKCVCAPGYVKNTTLNECSDIDECDTNPCSQLCTNTIGNYSCGCYAGFRLVGASQCEDIDECSAPTSPCDQICANTQGSFRCSCNAGFSLNTTTRVTCETNTRCENVTFNCTQKCGVNSDGSEYCFCNPGFILNNDGFICNDIDECSSNPCSEQCSQNTPGPGYTCSCAAGKKLDVDQRTCIDCDSQTFGSECSSNCTCDVQNTLSCDKVNGSCTCKTGWEGENCTKDIDECKENNTICPTNAECSNTNGSFSCVCNPGFALANGNCVECTSTTYGQDCANQCTCDLSNSRSCDKQNGTCYCNDGWMGVNCTEDIKECEDNSNICGANANCSDVPGSYICNCNLGYKKSANGVCEDVNECILGTDTCDANADCTNTVGGFNCTCKPGFSGDGFSCTSCNSTHFGEGCSSLCSCIEANTADCDDVTGTCKCKTTWNGTNCDIDINECDLGTHNCNTTYQDCENNDGGFNCVCHYGETNGVCNGGCNDTHYGYQCNQTCPCVLTNIADCHDDTGACTCKSGWTGVDCSSDRNECTTNKHDCNDTIETCSNIDGSWNCTCIYGNSNTGCIAKESEYTPESTELSVEVVVTFDETIDLSDYAAAKRNMSAALSNYYRRKIKEFIKVIILVMRKGSTIVEHEVVTNKTEKAQQDTALAVVSLSKGEDKVEYNNKNLSTDSVTVKDKSGNVKNITSSFSKCDVYIINFPCGSGEQCIESGDTVFCSKIADDNDEFKLIVGLGVGIPLFFIAVLILAIICVYWRRHKDDDSSSLSEDDFGEGYGSPGSYFPSVIPTKIDSWGRHVSPYSPHYLSDHSTIQGGNRVDDVTNYTEPYLYDNGEKSNFSWDFMFQSLHPNEKFQIRRPGIRSQPLKTE